MDGAKQVCRVTDYADANNWLAWSERHSCSVDVFYLYPTCYTPAGPDYPLVGTVADAGMRAKALHKLYSQAYAFGSVGDIFAPFYRQCDAARMAGNSWEEFCSNIAATKADVFASLDYFFAHRHPDRPFILAGHSQGSVMLCLVLWEYMAEHPSYLQRMVASYVIGFGVTKQYLQDNPHLRFAQGADDTGVIVSFNVEGPGNAGHANSVLPPGSIAINPLNWQRDAAYAGVEQNLGSLVCQGQEYRLVPGLADARIDLQRGVVVCDSLDPKLYASSHASMFGPESFHSYEYMLFFANIRANAALRTARYLETHR